MSDRRREGDRRKGVRTYVDKRRAGDERPYRLTRSDFTLWPVTPIRWLPRHGDPGCLVEWVSQHMIRSLASLPIYTAVVVTITLAISIWLVH